MMKDHWKELLERANLTELEIARILRDKKQDNVGRKAA